MTELNDTSELMFILLVYAVSFQIVQSSYPAVLDSIGVGYNILTGNPDGTDWRHGGEDPGLLVTRRILKLGKCFLRLHNVKDIYYSFERTCITCALSGSFKILLKDPTLYDLN